MIPTEPGGWWFINHRGQKEIALVSQFGMIGGLYLRAICSGWYEYEDLDYPYFVKWTSKAEPSQ